MKILLCAVRAGLTALCLFAAVAHASVVVSSTRVVFPAQEGEVTVRLSNEGNRPSLVEAWIDSGDVNSTPDKANTPFLITPPLFRMEANKDQNLRILATPAQLPGDRESLFWLNVLEIPSKPTTAETQGKNILQFAIRSRLKLFYRPAHLPGDPLTAPNQLIWKAIPDGAGYALEVNNPTPYHITFNDVSLDVGGKHYAIEASMVAPLGSLRLTFKGLLQAPSIGTPVVYDTVNDYGAPAAFKGSIAP
jgi:P pilus assembly chaperone PapD